MRAPHYQYLLLLNKFFFSKSYLLLVRSKWIDHARLAHSKILNSLLFPDKLLYLPMNKLFY